MVFVIPQSEEMDDGRLKFENLDQLETKIENKELAFSGWMEKLQQKDIQAAVDVYVPKFKVELSLDLTASLRKLGITDAFVPGGADFSNMNGAGNLYVSSAQHKACIEVDEEGTVAAAATGMAMNCFSMPTEVFLNHPFVFYIVHTATDAIIFHGKIRNPSK